MLSQASKYAVHAILYIAERDPVPVVRAKISEALDIPSTYLSKLLNRLVTQGILLSRRGPGGGYTLARPADGIALFEVIEAIQERLSLDECAFGLPYCHRQTECDLHARWIKIREEFERMLQEKISYAMTSSPPEFIRDDAKEHV